MRETRKAFWDSETSLFLRQQCTVALDAPQCPADHVPGNDSDPPVSQTRDIVKVLSGEMLLLVLLGVVRAAPSQVPRHQSDPVERPLVFETDPSSPCTGCPLVQEADGSLMRIEPAE
jgi:hypothetical protein